MINDGSQFASSLVPEDGLYPEGLWAIESSMVYRPIGFIYNIIYHHKMPDTDKNSLKQRISRVLRSIIDELDQN